MQRHLLECSEYHEAWKHDPENTLDPAAEYKRWAAEENSADAVALRRGDSVARRFAELDQARAASDRRWSPPVDPLL